MTNFQVKIFYLKPKHLKLCIKSNPLIFIAVPLGSCCDQLSSLMYSNANANLQNIIIIYYTSSIFQLMKQYQSSIVKFVAFSVLLLVAVASLFLLIIITDILDTSQDCKESSNLAQSLYRLQYILYITNEQLQIVQYILSVSIIILHDYCTSFELSGMNCYNNIQFLVLYIVDFF